MTYLASTDLSERQKSKCLRQQRTRKVLPPEIVRDCSNRQEQLRGESKGFHSNAGGIALGDVEVENGVVDREVVSVVDAGEVVSACNS